MTLVDSSALAPLRRSQEWDRVRAMMDRIEPFATGDVSPHELPGLMRKAGCRVGIVTASPRWYAEQVISDFDIEHDVLVSYNDTERHKPDPDPLNLALEQLNVSPSEAFSLGDDPIDSQAAYHAGLLSIGAGWGVTDFEALNSAAPDILAMSPNSLIPLDRVPRSGYLGEMFAAGQIPRLHRGSYLRSSGRLVQYSLGRYFPTGDARHSQSPLSALLLQLKNKDDPSPVFGQAVGTFLNRLQWVPNYVVPVPPKPSQNRNRFEALLGKLDPGLPRGVRVVLDGLKSVKEVEGYKAMNAEGRGEAIQGVYESARDWRGRRVLLLDDVLTTGETAAECARVLLASGADEVRILALGKDQMAFQRHFCSSCGRPMRIRTNGSDGTQFWGCTGYPSYCRHTEDL